MQRLFLPVSFMLPCAALQAQTFCTPQGNVAIYSNYDGGALTINVDQNIPDLHIGIVSYEFSRIALVGAYVNNVTAVWYAGYNADNNHCALSAPLATTITGAPAGADSILIYPTATYANANGWPSILCNYSCDVNTNQGGCNTADQIAHFFLTKWGGALLFHFTQYGCWSNGYTISGGGNCCENPLATGVADPAPSMEALTVTLINEQLVVKGQGPFEVIDAAGRAILPVVAGTDITAIDVAGLRNGSYAVRSLPTGALARFVVAR